MPAVEINICVGLRNNEVKIRDKINRRTRRIMSINAFNDTKIFLTKDAGF